MKAKNKIKKDRGYSIKIDQDTYSRLKDFCKDRSLKMGSFSSKAIDREIATLKNPHEVIYR